MVFTALLASQILLGIQDKPINLARINKAGEKLTYEVESRLNLEDRGIGLQTWMPGQVDINYGFTTEFEKAKADGIVSAHYKRPTVTVIQGETVDAGPKKTVEKTDIDLQMDLSPINEILNVKDLSKKATKKDSKDGGGLMLLHGVVGQQQPAGAEMLGSFIAEVQRLALFAGSFDSALDLAPKLPLDDVKVGDSWKRTVSYSPQKLSGKGDKMAVQRLDYTYTYGGIVESEGKKVCRVTAKLSLDTDLADFVNQLIQMKSDESGLKTIPLKLNATIDFDLDPQTHRTLLAVANSDGGFKFVVTQYPNDPIREETFKGHTELRLASVKS